MANAWESAPVVAHQPAWMAAPIVDGKSSLNAASSNSPENQTPTPANEMGLLERFIRLPETTARELYKSGVVGQYSGVINQAIAEKFPSVVLAPGDLIAAGVNKLTGKPTLASPSATYRQGVDAVGQVIPVFRKPETPTQELVSAAAGGAASAYGGTGVGGALSTSTNPIVAGTGDILRSAPGVQTAAGGSAGLSGELARQQGAGPVGQTLASVAGGVAGGLTAGTISPSAAPARLPAGSATTAEQAAALRGAGAQAESVAQQGAATVGLQWDALDEGLKTRLLDNTRKALETNSDLPPEALARKSIYESLGIKPTRALITRSFDDALNEQNLLTESEGRALRNIYIENNQNIRSQIQALAPQGVEAIDQPSFGQRFRAPIAEGERRAQSVTNRAYEAASSAEGGNTADITKLNAFLQENAGTLNNRPASAGLVDDLKSMGLMQREAASPELMPASPAFTLKKLASVRAATNEAWQTAKNTGDARAAGRLNELRSILDEMEADAGGDLYKAYRTLRVEKGARYENNPLIDKLLSDEKGYYGTAKIEDSQVFNQAVLNSTSEQFGKVWPRLTPQAKNLTRAQVAKYIEDKAFSNQGMNEAGDVIASSAKVNSALKELGPEKLQTIYGEESARKLALLNKAVQEISNPPRGTAPQGSAPKLTYLYRNTLSILGLAGKIPGLNVIVDVAEKRAASSANEAAVSRAINPLSPGKSALIDIANRLNEPQGAEALARIIPPSIYAIKK